MFLQFPLQDFYLLNRIVNDHKWKVFEDKEMTYNLKPKLIEDPDKKSMIEMIQP